MMVLYSGTTARSPSAAGWCCSRKAWTSRSATSTCSTSRKTSRDESVQQVPILVERDLILYESNIINEYIDERFPHPQLMPADPVQRARARLFLLNFEKELFVHVGTLENEKGKAAEKNHEKARAQIRDRLTQLAPIFLKNKYMLGEEFSMLDVAIAPLLWRWITTASNCRRTPRR
jgi:RNA polymerase-associated protein